MKSNKLIKSINDLFISIKSISYCIIYNKFCYKYINFNYKHNKLVSNSNRLNLKTLYYSSLIISVLLIYSFISNIAFISFSFANITYDQNIIKNIFTCSISSRTINENNVLYCKKWVYKFFNDLDPGYLECDIWSNVNKHTNEENVSDNIGWTKKYSIFHSDYSHSTYKCSDGNILSSNSCNVKNKANITSCTCGFCAARKTVGSLWACYATHTGRKKNAGTECVNAYITIRQWGCNECGKETGYYCFDWIYDKSSTEIKHYNEYYTYHLDTCLNPVVKSNIKITKIYDPNMVYQ